MRGHPNIIFTGNVWQPSAAFKQRRDAPHTAYVADKNVVKIEESKPNKLNKICKNSQDRFLIFDALM